MKIVARDIPPRTAWALEQAGVHPLLARLYAARGVQSKDELDDGLARLLPPSGEKGMKGIDAAARLLADAMAQNLRLVIVADYDCDGATACAVGVRALRAFGADVHYLVPDRVTLGYGLTPAMVEIAARLRPLPHCPPSPRRWARTSRCGWTAASAAARTCSRPAPWAPTAR